MREASRGIRVSFSFSFKARNRLTLWGTTVWYSLSSSAGNQAGSSSWMTWRPHNLQHFKFVIMVPPFTWNTPLKQVNEYEQPLTNHMSKTICFQFWNISEILKYWEKWQVLRDYSNLKIKVCAIWNRWLQEKYSAVFSTVNVTENEDKEQISSEDWMLGVDWLLMREIRMPNYYIKVTKTNLQDT